MVEICAKQKISLIEKKFAGSVAIGWGSGWVVFVRLIFFYKIPMT